jgi:hypothetical protein
MKGYQNDINADFTCRHCGGYVSAARLLAGVGNRNHCPYCLWSRHLDLFNAGDRLADCKAPMRPIGLTLKRSHNRYARALNGELMLVHECTDCERISINRIAADDIPEQIHGIFRASLRKSTRFNQQIMENGICLLNEKHEDIVCQQLFGYAARPVLDLA